MPGNSTHFLALSILAMISIESLNWTINDVSYLRLTTLGGGLISTFLVVILSKRFNDSKMMLVQNCVTLVPVILILIIRNITTITIQAALLYACAFILGLTDASCYCHILSISMVSKIVKADLQAIGEAVRLILFYIAYAISGFGTSAIFFNIVIGGGVILFANLVGIVLLAYDICPR